MSDTKRTTRRENDAKQLAVAIAEMCDFAAHLTARQREERIRAVVRAIVRATGNPEPE